MLSIELMSEASRRFTAPGSLRVLLDDACLQAAYCLDAPNEVQDGMEWFQLDDSMECDGPVPRWVAVRDDPANAIYTTNLSHNKEKQQLSP